MLEKDKYKLSTYRSVKTIRKTNTATVEIVENSLDGQQYVKKTYPADKREIFNILQNIDDPHIPRVYEVFFCSDTIVIEQYICGKTLEELIVEKHQFRREEICRIFEAILSAVCTLQQNHLIHRDIKPDNIIINESGQAVLIDYSIARIYSKNRSEDTERFGTVGYAAPEQFGFSQTDFRSDLYAFGTTMQQIVGRSHIPKVYSRAISKCAEFDPGARFQCADEVRYYLKSSRLKQQLQVAATALLLISAVCICAVHPWTQLPSKSNASSAPPSKTAETQEEVPPAESVEFPDTLPGSTYIESNHQDDAETPPSSDPDAEAEKPAQPADPSVAPNTKLVYSAASDRIVNTKNAGEDIPCLPLQDNGEYSVEVSLSDRLKPVTLDVIKSDTGFQLKINGETTFSFEQDDSLPTASYPGGQIYGELLLFDFDQDGVLEIIPILCNACLVTWSSGKHLLKNYSLGWCIDYDEEKGFLLAEGRMTARMDPFIIYASMPGCISTDFPAYYQLKDRTLVLNS